MSKAPRKPFQLTPEQMALSEARKAKKTQDLSVAQGETTHQVLTAERAWIRLSSDNQQALRPIKVLTWNLLAQCLIRRDLFPTSDCLKAGQREQMLYRELLAADADILCLQEVDRLEKLLPVLERNGYAHHYSAGKGKKHGCLIAFKTNLYTLVASRLIEYDNQEIRPGNDRQTRCGCSFRTRNIGSLVSLKSNITEDNGIVVATTHLFWHPKYTYERVRQTGILIRETVKFRTENRWDDWPCIIGGDFNFAPSDPAYSLLVGDELLPDQEECLTLSHVVHVSVDPTIPATTKDAAEEGEDEAVDPDRNITNARPAIPTDGLFSVPELIEFFSELPRLRSVYDEGIEKLPNSNGLRTFGHRVVIAPTRHGRNEPEYTSYTHYWKTVLDYIFVLEPTNCRLRISSLLLPPHTEVFKSGLPRKDVCSSDHISLAAELCWVYPATPVSTS